MQTPEVKEQMAELEDSFETPREEATELDRDGLAYDDPRKPRPTDSFPDVGYVRHMVGLACASETPRLEVGRKVRVVGDEYGMDHGMSWGEVGTLTMLDNDRIHEVTDAEGNPWWIHEDDLELVRQ